MLNHYLRHGTQTSRYQVPRYRLGFWNGVGSVVDLFGALNASELGKLDRLYLTSEEDDSRQLHLDWVRILPKEDPLYDKRQLRLNFESATSGK